MTMTASRNELAARLEQTLKVMKRAQNSGKLMSVWANDTKSVEDAVAALRQAEVSPSPSAPSDERRDSAEVIKRWHDARLNLSPDEQYYLAEMIANNVGYELTPEAEHPDSPHASREADSQLVELITDIGIRDAQAALARKGAREANSSAPPKYEVKWTKAEGNYSENFLTTYVTQLQHGELFLVYKHNGEPAMTYVPSRAE